MSIEVKIDQRTTKNTHRKKIGKNILKGLPLYIIISFLGIFFILRLLFGLEPVNSVRGVFTSREVIYNTYSVFFDDNVDANYKEKITESLSKIEYGDTKRFKFVDKDGDVNISADSSTGEIIFSERLIPVSHLYSLVRSVDLNDMDSLKDYNVYIIGNLYEEYLNTLLGKDVNVVNDSSELINALSESDSNIGFVLFGDLDPELKILSVNGEYFLDNMEACVKVSISANAGENGHILSVVKKNLQLDISNTVLNDELLSKVNMTGVTAITRRLASKMNSLENYDYPAELLGDFLADADLTHTSNEVSFIDGCAPVNGMRFCSDTDYLVTLERSGIDIIELTGNHNNDYGADDSAKSIEMYKDLGMRYFGGGLNEDDASKILYEEVNGTTVAFIGYNYYDTMLGTGAIASASRSGANSYSEEKMESDVSKAKENADIVIVDFQFQECYCYPEGDVIYPICYKPLSYPDQEGTFKKAVDFGADIVIGTQAHQPQTFEVYKDGVIFYGLGNLYFDQDPWIGTRQGIILSHYFYNGEHIQTRMTATYMDSDLQNDFATEEQADLLFELLKDAR